MAERRVKAQLQPSGQMVDATEVPVEESTERWSEIRLEDGTTLRIKMTVLSAIRLDGNFDPEGNPIYQIKGSPAVAVINVPAELKRKAVN